MLRNFQPLPPQTWPRLKFHFGKYFSVLTQPCKALTDNTILQMLQLEEFTFHNQDGSSFLGHTLIRGITFKAPLGSAWLTKSTSHA